MNINLLDTSKVLIEKDYFTFNERYRCYIPTDKAIDELLKDGIDFYFDSDQEKEVYKLKIVNKLMEFIYHELHFLDDKDLHEVYCTFDKKASKSIKNAILQYIVADLSTGISAIGDGDFEFDRATADIIKSGVLVDIPETVKRNLTSNGVIFTGQQCHHYNGDIELIWENTKYD